MNALPVHESPVGAGVDRAISVTLVAVAAGLVVVLARVTPDPRGFGTHELLGMSPCGWPSSYGIPCPTCGVTTAAAHLVHLEPWRALVTQPFGAVLAGFGLWLAGLALLCLWRRRSLVARVLELPYGSIFVGFAVLMLASWLYRCATWSA